MPTISPPDLSSRPLAFAVDREMQSSPAVLFRAWTEQIDRWFAVPGTAIALQSDFASRLPRQTPIFFYHGTADDVVPFAHQALYAKKLPRATVRALEGREHQLNNDLSDVAADIEGL